MYIIFLPLNAQIYLGLIIIIPKFSLKTVRNKKNGLQTWTKANKDVKFHVAYMDYIWTIGLYYVTLIQLR